MPDTDLKAQHNRTFHRAYSVLYNKSPQDLTGVDLTFRLVDSLGDGATELINKALDKSAETTGLAELNLTEAELEAIDTGIYHYSVVYEYLDMKKTLEQGKFNIEPGV